jgi:1-pyrroline-5-carboxylate dehydrogenase
LELRSNPPEEIPCFIGGDAVQTGDIKNQVAPYDHQRVVARYHSADESTVKLAIYTALAARNDWEKAPFELRASVLLKAADLMSTKYRYKLLAASMVGTAKTATQAEYDATCELIDFYRFAVKKAEEIHNDQQILHYKGIWNRSVYRGLEGFIAAVSPFNFTAIGGNLAGIPALMGNVVLWKHATSALLPAWVVFKILREAGLPDGVINFLPSSGPVFGKAVTSSPHLAGITFTGSGDTFKYLWKEVGKNVDIYRSFPRLVGECGGKNYHFIHPSADIATVVNGAIQSGFEYGGQKCSALSRMYVPESLWPEIRDRLIEEIKVIKVGSPEEPPTFYSAVIDQNSFNNIKDYIEYAKSNSDLKIIAGGQYDDSVGYYVYPTLVESKNPKSKLMVEEIFGPIVTVFVYPDSQLDETLKLVDETSPFGLTGSIYAQDSYFVHHAMSVLRHSAGNMYINDKSTGSVVGQQPFGGSRMSGTNDKTGTQYLLQKFVSPLAIKEQYLPLTRWSYPSMEK